MKADLTALILAGGRSRRFGADKARFPVAGRPMVERVYAAAAAVADTVLISLRAPTATPPVPARVVVDSYPDAGPLAGLHAGLHATSTPWLLVVACDLPFVTSHALHELVRHRKAGLQALVAADADGRRQPLCACYATTIRPLVEEQLAQGNYALFGLLDQLASCRTVRLAGDVLRNVNRPSDLD